MASTESVGKSAKKSKKRRKLRVLHGGLACAEEAEGNDDVDLRHEAVPSPTKKKKKKRKERDRRRQDSDCLAENSSDGDGSSANIDKHVPDTIAAPREKTRKKHKSKRRESDCLVEESSDGDGSAANIGSHAPDTLAAPREKRRKKHLRKGQDCDFLAENWSDGDRCADNIDQHVPDTIAAPREKTRKKHKRKRQGSDCAVEELSGDGSATEIDNHVPDTIAALREKTRKKHKRKRQGNDCAVEELSDGDGSATEIDNHVPDTIAALREKTRKKHKRKRRDSDCVVPNSSDGDGSAANIDSHAPDTIAAPRKKRRRVEIPQSIPQVENDVSNAINGLTEVMTEDARPTKRRRKRQKRMAEDDGNESTGMINSETEQLHTLKEVEENVGKVTANQNELVEPGVQKKKEKKHKRRKMHGDCATESSKDAEDSSTNVDDNVPRAAVSPREVQQPVTESVQEGENDVADGLTVTEAVTEDARATKRRRKRQKRIAEDDGKESTGVMSSEEEQLHTLREIEGNVGEVTASQNQLVEPCVQKKEKKHKRKKHGDCVTESSKDAEGSSTNVDDNVPRAAVSPREIQQPVTESVQGGENDVAGGVTEAVDGRSDMVGKDTVCPPTTRNTKVTKQRQKKGRVSAEDDESDLTNVNTQKQLQAGKERKTKRRRTTTLPSSNPALDTPAAWIGIGSQKDSFNESGIRLRTGTWSVEENQRLRANVEAFVKEQGGGVTAHDIIFKWTSRERGDFYRVVSKGLRRPLFATYRRLRRMYDPNNYRGSYSPEESAKLLELHKEYGPQWVKIGEELGRSSQSVLDKFQQLCSLPSSSAAGNSENGNGTAYRKPWTEEEKQKLVSYVHEVKGVPEGELIMDEVPWDAVALHMKTRSRMQCLSKYLLTSLGFARTPEARWTAADKLRLLDVVCDGSATDEGEIPWSEIQQREWPWAPVPFLKTCWVHLRRRIPNGHKRPLEDCLDYLNARVRPRLLLKCARQS